MEQKLQNTASQLPEAGLSFGTIAAQAERPQPYFGLRNRWVATVSVCLALLICLGFGTYAYAAEAREYSAAVQFFNDHGWSTEGLTRAEIKAIYRNFATKSFDGLPQDELKTVYRDITIQSFTFSETAEVIMGSLSDGQVGGYEIWQDAPTPEDLERIWNEKNDSGWFVPYEPDVYQFDLEHITNDDGRVVGKKSYFKKYEGETLLWRTEIPFWQGEYCEVPDGLIIFGHETTYMDKERMTDSWIAKLDHDGTILWIHQLANGFAEEYSEGVLLNADGSYTLFSRGDQQYLCVSRYTPEGERTLYKQTYLGKHSVGQMANFGENYLLQISTSEENEFARFIQVDQQGNVTDGFSYKDEKNNYIIHDMTEWGGKVYISAYATQKLGEDEGTYGGRTEIDPVLEYVFDSKKIDISSEELTPMVRDLYAAVLLICDPNDGGKIQVFYTIPGSLGADLFISDDGRLIWETECITSTFFSIATSSFTIGGICNVYQYALDSDGALVGQAITDRLVNYRR